MENGRYTNDETSRKFEKATTTLCVLICVADASQGCKMFRCAEQCEGGRGKEEKYRRMQGCAYEDGSYWEVRKRKRSVWHENRSEMASNR